MLEVQNLTKKFKNGKGIFDVTFSIKMLLSKKPQNITYETLASLRKTWRTSL